MKFYKILEMGKNRNDAGPKKVCMTKHLWINRFRSRLFSAVRGWEDGNLTMKIIDAEACNRLFEKVWRDNVLPEYKDDQQSMHRFHMLFKFAKCCLRFKIDHARAAPHARSCKAYSMA